ncbi:preprotein translocase subunit SecA [Asticcacaulis excentricus]|uniref:Protein translocase subunit SecA n=1 Tax=Asticcacaulis excentricus (strain ATCC 15261 / DSM 4724 / KCTC 12464 / NCIMB 9791 / VKM B-1370 / CB 48) TaxID=573065 RepID=E8RTS1_ASTEC|nr:preprotein translocase subunit SecA [Asticcacaulis excentricus]ADU14892.1 preprotein translocase, SecA subunit [Asticcacaulis excentricus CB 48]
MLAFAKSLFGSANERKVKSMGGRITRINALEPRMKAMSNEELAHQTVLFRERIANGASLDSLLEEAFATVREAAWRSIGQRHYDVQLTGGLILHQGGIAEMRTGEGKTLVGTAPVYLNALSGKGVHLITVNDYLAKRDADFMGRVYRFLGLSTGVIVSGMSPGARKAAYASDVTYGTNNEFGFDYLRDNLVYNREEMVQRGHHYAIVDEVDSILIDEARTPLIISGPTEDRSELYKVLDALIKDLIQDPETFELDEKQRQVLLSEAGSERLEEMLTAGGHLAEDTTGLYDAANVSLVHHANQALRANTLYTVNKDYIVKDGEIVLIDEFTGRMMQGRRLSEGLHQAIEAKEAVAIQPENQTLASVTIQNYFRMYQKLSGMTGTAATEAAEFGDIYKMDVLEVPTHRPIKRIDYDDEVYRTEREKFKAIADQVADCYVRGQPILVGTASIEKSDALSEFLKTYTYDVETKAVKPEYAKLDKKELTKLGDAAFDIVRGSGKGIPHNVLNARHHENEAYIIADAGVPGAVTIATNMAGRGTDIQLGGNVDLRVQKWLEEQAGAGVEVSNEALLAKKAEVETQIADLKLKSLAAGGLFVLGTERHESRRIDNQLRGRTGRQGDPGTSKFYLSCEDDLMRIFAGDRLNAMMKTLGVEEGEAITHKLLNSAIATAQKRVEQRNYEIRKNLLKYDDVVNDQRKAVFEQRQEFMDTEDLSEIVSEMREETIRDLVDRHLPPKAYAEQWDIAGLKEQCERLLGLDLPLEEWAAEEGIANEEIEERIQTIAAQKMEERLQLLGPDQMKALEKNFLLQMIDMQWREHLMHLDHLRAVIGLRGYGQRDPLNEYKTEAFALFETLLVNLRHNVTRWLMTVEIRFQGQPEPEPVRFEEIHLNPLTGENERAPQLSDDLTPEQRAALPVSALPAGWESTSRNGLCPCGSGKKFKHCHGALI